MVLQPIIEGMLGYSAQNSLLVLSPAIPFQWDEIRVQNIRRINGSIDMEMERFPKKTIYSFTGIDEFTTIVFDPKFMAGTKIESLKINGKKRKKEFDNSIRAAYPMFEDTEFVIHHSGGISAIPPIEKPAPNEKSRGIHIIDDSWEDNTYTIRVEGAAGMQYELEVINNFGTPRSVEGAKYREDGNRLILKLDFPAMNRGYKGKTIKISF